MYFSDSKNAELLSNQALFFLFHFLASKISEISEFVRQSSEKLLHVTKFKKYKTWDPKVRLYIECNSFELTSSLSSSWAKKFT